MAGSVDSGRDGSNAGGEDGLPLKDEILWGAAFLCDCCKFCFHRSPK